MTGILIFGGTILLLVLALEPAQRRLQTWAPRPGVDSSRDRDTQRLQQELSARVSDSTTRTLRPGYGETSRQASTKPRTASAHLGRRPAA